MQRRSLLLRWAKKVSADYDLRICSDNECDLGSPAIQYIHTLNGAQFKQWRSSATKMELAIRACWIRGHIRFWMMLSLFSFEQVCHLTLANSNWTAQRIREIYDIPVTTLYPPARISPRGSPGMQGRWHCLHRPLIACKQYERVIRVVEAARAMGKMCIFIWQAQRYSGRIDITIGSRLLQDNDPTGFILKKNLRAMSYWAYRAPSFRDSRNGRGAFRNGRCRNGCQRNSGIYPRTGGPQEIVGEEDALQYSSEQDC